MTSCRPRLVIATMTNETSTNTWDRTDRPSHQGEVSDTSRKTALWAICHGANLTAERSKDRANLLLSVTYADGEAAVAAIARSLDRLSLTSRAFALAPAGRAPLDVSKVSVVAPESEAGPVRRRAARH